MSIDPGTRFGPFEIVDAIGAGGMGEVYRATDTNLNRDVAIKVLPESFINDADRVARFRREAELLASLNHPNIGQIYGLEQAGDKTAIVMELVEGPTLADRIAEGPLPPDEALTIARQIADALEAAHAQRIVHRDLKPANVKLKRDGTIKVLDFGIAKPLDAQGSSGEPAPVMTTPAMTQTGIVMGTAQYMSPEQARGRFVDERTDIWAFGCLLFEMLTGQPAFGGEDIAETMARIIALNADIHSLPGVISPAVRHTIKLCLEKNPKARIADIRDVRLALEGKFETDFGPLTETGVAALPFWRRVVPHVATGLAVALVIGGTWLTLSPDRQPQPVNRFTDIVPENQAFRNNGENVVAISPNGRYYAYNTNDGLYLRDLETLDSRLIRGTEGPIANPFFSADSRSIAYVELIDATPELRRISLSGGAAVTVTETRFGQSWGPYGASWSVDGTILYGQADGIYRVAATGGTPELVIEAREGETLTTPSLLPDGDTVLFTAGDIDNWDQASIMAESLSTKARTEVLPGGSDARYVPTGHLVYVLDDTLLGIAFDTSTLTVSGGAEPLVQGLARAGITDSAHYGISNDGTLIYLLGGPNDTGSRTLAWVGRDGDAEPIALDPGNYLFPRLSPDRSRVVLDDRNVENDLWVWNFGSENRLRITGLENGASFPTWYPDGSRIAFLNNSSTSIDWKAANDTGQVTALLESELPALMLPYFITTSGQLVFAQNRGSVDIGIASIDDTPDQEPAWLVDTSALELNADLHPNEQWIAYQSDESGRYEIYVSPFPDVGGDKQPVSNAGGIQPLWSRAGDELFYLQYNSNPPRMISVSFEIVDGDISFGDRQILMDWPYLSGNPFTGRVYDYDNDRQQFLAIKDVDAVGNVSRFVIVENFDEELRRRVPTD